MPDSGKGGNGRTACQFDVRAPPPTYFSEAGVFRHRWHSANKPTMKCAQDNAIPRPGGFTVHGHFFQHYRMQSIFKPWFE